MSKLLHLCKVLFFPSVCPSGPPGPMVRDHTSVVTRAGSDTAPTGLPLRVYSLPPSLTMATPGHVRSGHGQPEMQVAHAFTPSGMPVFFAPPPGASPTPAAAAAAAAAHQPLAALPPSMAHTAPIAVTMATAAAVAAGVAQSSSQHPLPPGAPILVQTPPASSPVLHAPHSAVRFQSAVPPPPTQTLPPATAGTPYIVAASPSLASSSREGRMVASQPPTSIPVASGATASGGGVVSVYPDTVQSQACSISLQRASLIQPPGGTSQAEGHHPAGGSTSSENQCLVATVELDGISYEGILLPKRLPVAHTPSSGAAGSA
eukprot:scpid62448/ scgid5131/ 